MSKADALEYVRGLYPYAGVEMRQLYNGESHYRAAQRSENCEVDCPGVDRCEFHGWKTGVCEDDLFGGRVYVVRVSECEHNAAVAKQKRLRDLVVASRIPKELSECTFASFKPVNDSTKTALKLAEHCAKNGEGLILCGTPGVGKTHLAVAAMQAAIASGRSAVFLPVVNLLGEMREAMLSNRIDNVMKALREADCIALDDLGMQKDSDWVGERLYEIVNDRYNARKQLVITSNARSTEDLASMIGTSGKQIASRLREITSFIKIEAGDYRLKKIGQRNQKMLNLEGVA